jgi:hypothetical protein
VLNAAMRDLLPAVHEAAAKHALRAPEAAKPPPWAIGRGTGRRDTGAGGCLVCTTDARAPARLL